MIQQYIVLPTPFCQNVAISQWSLYFSWHCIAAFQLLKMSSCFNIESDVAGIARSLATSIGDCAKEAIARDGIFKIGLSGGSLVHHLSTALSEIDSRYFTDWSKWRFFFCDERIVPFDNKESIYGVYKASLVGKLPIAESQFVTVDPDLSAEEAAKDYIKKMSVYFPPHSLPRFDMLLLGMGDDGHTCSLFPGHRVLNETSLWVCPITDSPKPPPSRITLTFPVINNARFCIFVVTGSTKAKMVHRVWEMEENFPAAMVQPTDGKLRVILDEAAGSLIKS